MTSLVLVACLSIRISVDFVQTHPIRQFPNFSSMPIYVYFVRELFHLVLFLSLILVQAFSFVQC